MDYKLEKLSLFSSWTKSVSGKSYLFEAKNIVDFKRIIELARKNNLKLLIRGAGCSYGDEILNDNNIIITLDCLNKVIMWDSDKGIMVVEPGVTFEQILTLSLKDNWILPVVPGTKFPTIGGAISNNVHGKNSFKEGNLGDWVVKFALLLASSDVVECSREKNKELFYSAIGGLGLLGIFTEITLQLKPIPSPFLSVKKWTEPNLFSLIDSLESSTSSADFVIGQVDCFPKGNNLGRGTVHTALFTKGDGKMENEKMPPHTPNKFINAISNPFFLNIARFLMSDMSMRSISNIKFYMDNWNCNKSFCNEHFFDFNFLLDKIPNWKNVFMFGFVEHESLISKKKAGYVFEKIIKIAHQFKIPPYLCAIKAHKKDEFLLSFSKDGYSLGIDFPIVPRRFHILKKALRRMDEIILENGGLVYLAKDSLMDKDIFNVMYEGNERFKIIKKKYDPENLFQSNMYRRLFKQM